LHIISHVQKDSSYPSITTQFTLDVRDSTLEFPSLVEIKVKDEIKN